VSVRQIVAIHGSSREQQMSDAMLEHFLVPFAADARFHIEHVRISALHIIPCTVCGSCQTSGECPVPDDMQTLYPLLECADIVVFGIPVYFNSVPGPVKIMIDRCQPYYYRKYVLGRPLSQKTGVILSCCEHDFNQPFVGVEKTISALFCCMNTILKGTCYSILNGKSFCALPKEIEKVQLLSQQLFEAHITAH